MRLHSFSAAILATALIIPIHCLTKLHNGVVTLSPINSRDLENAYGLHARGVEDHGFSDLDPSTQARLVYGSPGGNGGLLLADIRLHAPSGRNIVMLEKFDGYTKSVDCNGDDGLLSLTFKSKEVFRYAVKTWNYINAALETKFLLIANHKGCGPDDERQPYWITKIRNDESTLTTFLTAEVVSWSDVAGKFDLEFGKVISHSGTRQFKSRQINDKFGAFEFSENVAFDIDVGQPGVRTNIFNSEDNTISVDCLDCYVTGGFQITGRLSVDNFALAGLTFDASPQDVVSQLELEATITAAQTLLSINQTKELFAGTIPESGITVSGLFKISGTTSYEVSVSSSFKGQGLVEFGSQVILPNSAKITVNVENEDESTATGFEGSSITPDFNITSLTASVDFVASSKVKAFLSIDIVAAGHVDAVIALQVPKITTTLTSVSESAGFCAKDVGALTTGVQVKSKVEAEVEVDIELGAILGKPPFHAKIPAFSRPVKDVCFPIDKPDPPPVIRLVSTTPFPDSSKSSILPPKIFSSAISPSASPLTVTPSVSPSPTTRTLSSPTPPFPTSSSAPNIPAPSSGSIRSTNGPNCTGLFTSSMPTSTRISPSGISSSSSHPCDKSHPSGTATPSYTSKRFWRPQLRAPYPLPA